MPRGQSQKLKRSISSPMLRACVIVKSQLERPIPKGILVAKYKTPLFLIQYRGRCRLKRERRRREMALKPRGIPEIPPETVRAARAVFPKGNIYIFLRD